MPTGTGAGPPARWRVAVHGSACRGSGVCVGLAPAYFEADASGRSHPTAGEIAPDEIVLDAANACPLEAIEVTDGAGRRLAPTW